MRIILVGGGKVGTALARQLSEEDHNVTVIDTNKARVEHLSESYDVMGIVGNGSSSPPCPKPESKKPTCSSRSPAPTS